MHRLDFRLSMMESRVTIAAALSRLDASRADRPYPEEPPRQPLYPAERLQQHLLEIESVIKNLKNCTKRYEPCLTRLYQCWEANDWEACQRLIQDVRREAREPDEQAARTLITSLELPAKWAWLIKRLVPIVADVQRWRNSFVKDRLYLESRYYCSMAKYQSFEERKLHEAMTDARELHARLLVGAASPGIERARREELRKLLICLEADAAVRIVINDETDSDRSGVKSYAKARLYEIVQDIEPTLHAFTAHESGDVAAAAYSTLGLLQRYKQRPNTWLLGTDSRIELDEVSCFEKSLKLRSSANTYTFLAESLEQSTHHQEACRLLAQALQRCPQHALALALQQKWCAPDHP
jgi:hypothetical protein